MPTELPCRRRRHGAGIDRIEIAPGRQDVGAAAARRAARSGRNEAAVEPGENAMDFRRAAGRDRRPQYLLDPAQHRARRFPFGLGFCRAGEEPQSERLQPFDRIGDRAPAPTRALTRASLPRLRGRVFWAALSTPSPASGGGLGWGLFQHLRFRAGPGIGGIERERVAKAEIGGERADQRLVLWRTASPRARNREQQFIETFGGRALAENMQAVADLQILQLAQKYVEFLQCFGLIVIPADAGIAVDAGAPRSLESVVGGQRAPPRGAGRST